MEAMTTFTLPRPQRITTRAQRSLLRWYTVVEIVYEQQLLHAAKSWLYRELGKIKGVTSVQVLLTSVILHLKEDDVAPDVIAEAQTLLKPTHPFHGTGTIRRLLANDPNETTFRLDITLSNVGPADIAVLIESAQAVRWHHYVDSPSPTQLRLFLIVPNNEISAYTDSEILCAVMSNLGVWLTS